MIYANLYGNLWKSEMTLQQTLADTNVAPCGAFLVLAVHFWWSTWLQCGRQPPPHREHQLCLRHFSNTAKSWNMAKRCKNDANSHRIYTKSIVTYWSIWSMASGYNCLCLRNVSCTDTWMHISFEPTPGYHKTCIKIIMRINMNQWSMFVLISWTILQCFHPTSEKTCSVDPLILSDVFSHGWT